MTTDTPSESQQLDDKWLWEDEYEPKIQHSSVVYRIKPTIPSYVKVSSDKYTLFIDLRVYESDGLCELDDFYWFGIRPKKSGGYRSTDPQDAKILLAQKDVWGYLTEWEFVTLKAIGPEDSEYFTSDEFAEKVKKGKRWERDPETGI